jgi:hypothetical protein
VGRVNGGNRCFLGFVCCFAMHAPTPFRAGRAMYNPCLECYIFLLFSFVVCWVEMMSLLRGM